MNNKVFLHCDVNNFYASVAMVLDANLKDKPVAVSGSKELRRGIILAKSRQAAEYGVRTGETIWEAMSKCPELILVPPVFDEYKRFSDMIYEIYKSYTPFVESFGQDECWLDITEVVNSIEEGAKVADSIRKEVRKKTGGLTISIGVSFTKTFAKLGSDLKKTYGLTIIDKNNYKDVLYKLPVQSMIYVGRATNNLLNKLNIFTIGDLAGAHDAIIINELGKNGERLLSYARGIETEGIKKSSEFSTHQSVGNGTTLPRDIKRLEDVKRVIYALSEMVAFRLRKYNMLCNGVSLTIKDNIFSTKSKQVSLGFHTCSSSIIADKAIEIFNSFYSFDTMLPIRAITVTSYDLIEDNQSIQLSFFDHNIMKSESLEKTIDDLRSKFGYDVLKRGTEIAYDVSTGEIIEDDVLK